MSCLMCPRVDDFECTLSELGVVAVDARGKGGTWKIALVGRDNMQGVGEGMTWGYAMQLAINALKRRQQEKA